MQPKVAWFIVGYLTNIPIASTYVLTSGPRWTTIFKLPVSEGWRNYCFHRSMCLSVHRERADGVKQPGPREGTQPPPCPMPTPSQDQDIVSPAPSLSFARTRTGTVCPHTTPPSGQDQDQDLLRLTLSCTFFSRILFLSHWMYCAPLACNVFKKLSLPICLVA